MEALKRTGAEIIELNKADVGSKKKYLIFKLKDDRYGIPLSTVKEIIGMTKITKVPQVPAFFTGLINLRGRIISVLDLRMKLGVEASKYHPKKTSIIIVEVDGLLLGAIVDDVKEVVNLEVNQIQRDIDLKRTSQREYILGVMKAKDEELTLLLDIEKTLGSKELALLKSESKAA